MPYAYSKLIDLNSKQINLKSFDRCGREINYIIEPVDSELNKIHQFGELVVESAVNFSGYLSNDTLLKEIEAFPQRVYRTGDLVEYDEKEFTLHGRIDRQVKIQGNRVELNDIETSLENLPLIREAAVVFNKEKNTLTAYVVITDSGNDKVDIENELRLMCNRLIPFIMHPNEYVFIEKMPRTISGKKDRKKLLDLHHIPTLVAI